MDDENNTNEDEYSRPLRLGRLVGYQKDAVVSRTIIDEDAGTITVFSFDAKQGLSEHVAPYDAFVSGVDGEAQIKVGGIDSVLKKGEMMLIPANRPHSIRAITKFKMLLVMIRK